MRLKGARMFGTDAQKSTTAGADRQPDMTIEQKIAYRSPNAVFFVSPEWHIVYANRRAADLALRSSGDINGGNLWTIFPEFAEPEAREHCLGAMREQVEVEFDQKMSSGKWFHVLIDPSDMGATFYCQDITAFKLAEETLMEREAELKDFFVNGNIPMHWVGSDGTILWANEAELAMLGYAAEEYIGHNIVDFHVDRPVIDDILSRLTLNEKLHNYEARLRCKDGSIRHVVVSSSVYRKGGQFVHTRCFTRDVTAEKAKAEFQERLGVIIQSSDDAIISEDLNGVITGWNKSAERVFGYTAEEAIGQPVATLLIPDDNRDEGPAILAKLRSGEHVDHFETTRKRKDGTLVEISLTISPLKDSRGGITGVSEIARDISERRRSESASRLLSAIVDSSDDAIISKDLNGIITSWNESAERLFGYTSEEAVGQAVATLLIPDDRQEEEPAILAKLRNGERVDHFETKRRRKDGTLLDISLTISPVKGSGGRIIGASKIARDITAQVNSQKALRGANEALKRSNADLEQFAYSASHDLQEPLRMVSAYSDMLRKKYSGKLDPSADQYIDFVIAGATRMERLLHDLRAFTQALITNDGPPPVADARAALDNALTNLKTSIEGSGADIVSGPLPCVSLHDFQLEQIFQNIVGNAIRYRSQATPAIRIEASPSAGMWQFSIRDNGIGIAPEYKEQIFGIFKRLHSASEYPGTGMGLAICQRIVERAGGKIWVESEPGRGSSFFFLLPGASADTQRIQRAGAGDSFNRG